MERDIEREISDKYCIRFGILAVNKGFVTPDQLKEALIEQVVDNLSNRPHRQLGRILFEKGLMTDKQIEIVMNALFKALKNNE
ncbi:MAG: hypothetical protein AABY49_03865 [Planctomycetota bacterium]